MSDTNAAQSGISDFLRSFCILISGKIMFFTSNKSPFLLNVHFMPSISSIITSPAREKTSRFSFITIAVAQSVSSSISMSLCPFLVVRMSLIIPTI